MTGGRRRRRTVEAAPVVWPLLAPLHLFIHPTSSRPFSMQRRLNKASRKYVCCPFYGVKIILAFCISYLSLPLTNEDSLQQGARVERRDAGPGKQVKSDSVYEIEEEETVRVWLCGALLPPSHKSWPTVETGEKAKERGVLSFLPSFLLSLPPLAAVQSLRPDGATNCSSDDAEGRKMMHCAERTRKLLTENEQNGRVGCLVILTFLYLPDRPIEVVVYFKLLCSSIFVSVTWQEAEAAVCFQGRTTA